jgi:hypothetical protein
MNRYDWSDKKAKNVDMDSGGLNAGVSSLHQCQRSFSPVENILVL